MPQRGRVLFYAEITLVDCFYKTAVREKYFSINKLHSGLQLWLPRCLKCLDQGSECPLWVISRHLQCKTSCPLYTQKRTCAVQLRMSAKRQRTFTNRTETKRKTASRRSLRIIADQAASGADFFFLRQPNSPIAPRPVLKSGRVAGRGVAAVVLVSSLSSPLGAPSRRPI